MKFKRIYISYISKYLLISECCKVSLENSNQFMDLGILHTTVLQIHRENAFEKLDCINIARSRNWDYKLGPKI